MQLFKNIVNFIVFTFIFYAWMVHLYFERYKMKCCLRESYKWKIINHENSKYSLKNIIYILINTFNKIDWAYEILKWNQDNKL